MLQDLLRDIDRTVRQTLYGGNDPEDHGDLRQAVAELAEVVEAVVKYLIAKEQPSAQDNGQPTQ